MTFLRYFFYRYLIEIAKIYNIEYEPDPQVMREDSRPTGMPINSNRKFQFEFMVTQKYEFTLISGLDGMLIDLQPGGNNLGGRTQPPMGFIDFPQPPALPVMPHQKPFVYPTPGTSSSHTNTPPFNYNIPPYPPLDQEKKDLNTQFLSVRLNHSIVLR